MIHSMTGFGNKEAKIDALGKVSVELRSTNHKFLETVIHLPEGLLFLEEKIKKEVESKIKRGRITCAINVIGTPSREIFINEELLKKYLAALKKIKNQCRIKSEMGLDALINLPGVLALGDSSIPKEKVWSRLNPLVTQAVAGLAAMRLKEGRALHDYLKTRAAALKVSVGAIKKKFQKAIKERLAKIATEEERTSFLKNSDITEELERISYHLNNFLQRIATGGAVGKELDFIAQEMQREANTMGAKSCAGDISAKVVKVKSEIEKLREQLQNVE